MKTAIDGRIGGPNKHPTDVLNDPAVQRLHKRTKRRLARLGLNILRRRNGKFWLLYKKPMTLGEINKFIATVPKH
jgi:hypothetical protein